MAGEKGDKATILAGDFRLRKKLGQGGMGTVYLGQQLSLDRACAVKVLSKEMAAKPGFVERFQREAKSMAKINHPNVVSCYAVGEDKGHHFVAMELMDGQSMQDWLDELGQIPIPDAVLVGLICAEALQHAHELNMIHRDIKPDNILVTAKGIIKVADLGLAKAVDEEDMSLTQSGTGLGTPHYMPPEQARNAKHVDQRCDIYALGCTLYHFLTGKTPFSGESILELIKQKAAGKYTPPKQLNKDIPSKLDLIIGKAIDPNPKTRYATCAEFAQALESLALASDSLSFITHEKRAVARRGSQSAPTMVGGNMSSTRGGATMANISDPPPSRKKKTKAPSSPSLSDGSFFVRHTDSGGKVKVAKMSTPQILQAVKSDKFNAETKVAVSSKGPFLPLAQVPAFESAAKKMLTRQSKSSRNDQIAAEYEKIAKQYDRRKWWQFIGRFMDGTMGLVGLLIWLAVIAGIGFAIYLFVPMLFDMMADKIGIQDVKPE